MRMGDAITVTNMPAGLDAYAGYTAGHWPTYPTVVATFPNARHLSIAISAGHKADCLDIEPGDATNDQAPAWLASWQPGNTSKPVLYTSASNGAALIQTLERAGYGRDRYLYWSAHYTNTAHICGPVCRYPQADGTQWTTHGDSWDESLLVDSFFGPAPTPTPQPEDEVGKMYVVFEWRNGLYLSDMIGFVWVRDINQTRNIIETITRKPLQTWPVSPDTPLQFGRPMDADTANKAGVPFP